MDLPLTPIDMIWVVSFNYFILSIISGLLINQRLIFLFSLSGIINIIIFSIIYQDNTFFIYKLPIIAGVYLVITFLSYYTITTGRKTRKKLKRYSQFLQKSQEKYKALFDNSRDLMFVMNIGKDGTFSNFIEFNKITYTALNYTKEELYNLSLKDIIRRPVNSKYKDEFEFFNILKSQLLKDNYAVFEGVLLGNNKKRMPVEVNMQSFDIPNQSIVLTVIRDISEQKCAEDILQKIESDYKFLFANMLNGFAYHKIVTDETGKAIDYIFIDVNEAYEKLIGVDREDIIGKRVTKVIPDIQEQEHWIDYYEEVALYSKEARFEVYYKSLDKWLYIYAYSPKRMFFTVIIEDVTENKKSKISLIESEKKYRTLVETAIDAIFVEEIDGTIIDCNASACSMYGFSKDEIIGKTAFDLSPDFVSQELNYTLADEVKNGGVSKETYAKKKGDIIFPIDLRTRVVEISGKSLIIAYVHDITESKKNQERLKESETKYKTLFNTATSAIFLETYDGKIIDCNDTACKMLGYSREELLKLNAYDLIPQEDVNNLFKIIGNDFNKKLEEGLQFEGKNIKKDSTTIHVQTYSKEITINNEKYILIYITDITLRKKAMEELKSQKQLLDELFNNIQEGIQILDENEYIIFCNPASERIFGVEEGKLAGRSILEFLDDEGKKVVSYQRDLRKKNVASTYEVPIITDKGKRRIIRIIATPRNDNEGQFIGVFAAFIDITYQHSVQEALKESEEKYRTLVENSTDAIILIQKNKIIFHNKTAENLWDYDTNELRNKTLEELVVDEHRDIVINNYLNRIKGKKVKTNYEIKIKTKAGNEIWSNVSAVRTMWNNNSAVLAFIRDITEQKIAQQRIIEAKEKAEESSRLKNEFLANVSHELRTPLNSIMGFSQIMKLKDKMSSESRKEMSKRIYKSSKTLLSLIKNILEISAMEHGKYIINKELFNPLKLIKEVIENFENIIIKKGLNIKIENEKYIPELIFTDKQKLNQIFNNLIDNAIKFTPKGRIIIKYNKDYPDKTKSRFSIIDTGIGISEDKKHLLFQSFTQVDGSITRNYGGTGLGLSITKNLVKILGGEIEFESTKQKGTAFHFTITITR